MEKFLFTFHLRLVEELEFNVAAERDALIERYPQRRLIFPHLVNGTLEFTSRLPHDVKLQRTLTAVEVRKRLEHEFFNEERNFGVIEAVAQQRRVVIDVPPLARYRDALFVVGALLAVVAEGVVRRPELFAVQHVAADHGAGAALAGFAVDDGDVAVVRRQPAVDVGAERLDQLHFGGVVVVERVRRYPLVELANVVGTLAAKVVDFVVVLVFRIEEFLDVVDVVTVNTL